ncbi:MAG: HU family DNA-binding protein [candidate division WOR-3 bacterium]
MNKKELIDAIAKDVGCKKTEAKAMLESLINNIVKGLKQGKRIAIVDFGTFYVKKREARVARNPQKPDQIIKVPARKVPVFRPGKSLKEAVK